MLNKPSAIKRKFLNYLQSFIVIFGTAILIAIAAALIYGSMGVILALTLWFLLIILIPIVNPRSVLKIYKAKKLSYDQVPALYEMIYSLSKKAKLEYPPKLFYIQSDSSLAFSTGTKGDSAIALSDALFKILNKEEIYGVLAHEISHIKNNDIWLMQITDTASKVASLVAYTGQILLLLLVPFIDIFNLSFWVTLLVFVLIPPFSILMQLSLSRIREYGADLDSAILTQNPRFLISALKKLDYIEENIFNQLFNPFSKSSEPSILRTHPSTKKRIQRLEELSSLEYPLDNLYNKENLFFKEIPMQSRTPKRRYFHWYY